MLIVLCLVYPITIPFAEMGDGRWEMGSMGKMGDGRWEMGSMGKFEIGSW
jgi:hypothetical protein